MCDLDQAEIKRHKTVTKGEKVRNKIEIKYFKQNIRNIDIVWKENAFVEVVHVDNNVNQLLEVKKWKKIN